MNATNDQIELLTLLDKALAVLDANDINKFLEEKEIIMRLKGAPVTKGIIHTTVDRFNALSDEVMSLRNENIMLKSDFQKLLTGLNKTVFTYSHEFDDLKRKHNVY